MTDERPSDVLGGLPRRRPHRRSDKRGAQTDVPAEQPAGIDPGAPTKRARPPKQAAGAKSAPKAAAPQAPAAPRAPAARRTAAPPRTAAATPRLHQPAQPAGAPTVPSWRRPAAARGTDLVGTAVKAAAELAEIGLSVSARALRGAVSRLPRP